MPSIATLRALVGLRSWAFALPKNTWNLGKSTLNFIKENPKQSFIGGGIVAGQFNGNGAVRTWSNWILAGKEDDTLAEKLNKTINGNKAQGHLVGDTLDSVAGEGTAKDIVDTVRNVKDGTVSAIGATKDAVANGVDAARGHVSGHVPSMPSMNQYADQQVLMAQGQYPSQMTAQYPVQQGQGMSLADFSPFSGFKNLLNTVTGGNTNMMSVAAMIPAAMLMFGNFGWMGKIASMMLGSMALKNMNHPAPQQNMQMQYQPQMVQEQFQQNYNQQLAVADEKNRREEADDNVIMRRFHS